MKRIYTPILLLLIAAFTATAQEDGLQQKQYTPEAGDFGITVSANPLVNFLGNMFNGSASNNIGDIGGEPYNPGLNTLQPTVSFAGRYFISDNFALRMNIGWMYSHDKNNFYAPDDAARAADPLSNADVIDSHIQNTGGGSFMIGAEYRVGEGRVQGVFGGGLLYAFNRYKSKYSYGNAITDINQQPSTGINNSTAPAVPGFSYQRYLSTFSTAPTHYFGLMGYVGIEWFFAPKISIGAEVNLTAAFNWTKGTYYTAEGFNTLSGEVEEWTELLTPTSSGFDFGTKNIGANLSFNFYF